MDAVSRPFSQIINGAKQFVIPVFQRDYSWGWEQCLQMWSDIRNSRGEGDNNHFLGSFVYVEGNAGAAFSSWLVIDGQQRITTLTLLMVALRDHVLETQWNGEEPTVGRIDAYFLKNREESGERGYRLALRRRDNETLRALIDGKDVSEIADSSELILDAYTYFRELLRGPGVDPAQIYEGVHRLVVVDVKLQLAVDNPQLIFESLNSTGIDLTQSDLIRNYLLMGLPEEDQTRLYNDYWSRMEATFRHAGGGLDYFLRDYIDLKQELTTQPLAEKIYAHFKSFWPQSEVVTTAERLEEVVEFGQYYASFLRPALTRDKELVRPLSNVREGGFGTAHAILVVRLYDLFGRGLLSVGEFSDAMTHLLEEVKSFCQQDVTPHLDALSNACPTSFRDRLRETRNLLAAHRDERVLYRRLTGEHTARAINAYLRLGIEVPEGSMDSEIIAFSPPPGASDEEAAEGAPRVGQIGGGIAHLGEITQRMGQLDEALSSLRQNLSQPKQSQQDRRHSQPDVSTSPVEPTHCECRNRCATRR